MSKFSKFLNFTVRGALFGATLYGSSELGLWKDPETSREIAKLIIAILTPYTKKVQEQLPEQVSSLPTVENFKSTTTCCWNKSVYNAGEFVIDIPNKCLRAADKAYQLVEVQINKSKENE
ncbi:MICOS complex subunit MIC13 homolog QIL1 [Daktulosphaira vitifoliae]|uniref:MICOS complex subunit MIC13 homolog QIL1 n=1 Tax=Daktulosphaira vitifoliae TaxID=58002 RepID=UPI0021AAFE56|nr:MICOS complex subunit MIC13 homolog QIL1 [Daktulosphaira vitifoliae]XP_050539148.1 MICOS complex subunit MIC13 homolog QIL1 [Daktulosphaira vitifoliae]